MKASRSQSVSGDMPKACLLVDDPRILEGGEDRERWNRRMFKSFLASIILVGLLVILIAFAH